VTALLLVGLRVTAILASALALMPLLRRYSAATRAWVLLTALAAAALVPMLGPLVPAWGQPLAATASLPLPASSNTVFVLWAVGAAIQLAILFAGIIRLLGIGVTADPIRDGVCADLALDIAAEYRVHAPVVLLEANRPVLPVTWGHREPKVLLPPAARDWTAARARIVLRHELAHIRRRDWLVLLFARIVRSVYWFHPLVWLACALLRLECERACDDAVLRSGVSGREYAEHLLELARGFVTARDVAVAPGLARRSSLEQRIRAMLATRVDRSSPGRLGRLSVAAAMFALALASAGFGAAAPALPQRQPSAPPHRLTLLLDGRMMDRSKERPTYPDPRAGLVEGPGIADDFR
jgi:beta-lactamase regulating signal transducer with metallopeptidase domain